MFSFGDDSAYILPTICKEIGEGNGKSALARRSKNKIQPIS